ncbi:MAG: DUF357 domain-containing protein [Candidatus Thermoplasmatota archaeon]|jgi:hypothetical protein|nr:DUF357 domain-containing protein [Candidatus Thermoplasmatota archaeon]
MTIQERCKKYLEMTSEALRLVKISPSKESFLNKVATDFIEMCNNYLKDATFFYEKGDYENSLAASSYAYAWLDAGVRLGILSATGDYKRFTQYS